MLVFAREVHHLRDLCLSHFISIDPAFAHAMVMYMRHNAVRRFAILVEKALEHVNDELHRGVVVIEDEHPIHTRTLGLWLCLGDDRRAGTGISAAFPLVPCHLRPPKRVTPRTGRFIVRDSHGRGGEYASLAWRQRAWVNNPGLKIIRSGPARFQFLSGRC